MGRLGVLSCVVFVVVGAGGRLEGAGGRWFDGFGGGGRGG